MHNNKVIFVFSISYNENHINSQRVLRTFDFLEKKKDEDFNPFRFCTPACKKKPSFNFPQSIRPDYYIPQLFPLTSKLKLLKKL
jgi:hypothetical protein